MCGAQESVLEKEQLRIEEAYCIGCGVCNKLAPDDFKIINKKAVFKNNNPALSESIREAALKCPVKAIKL